MVYFDLVCQTKYRHYFLEIAMSRIRIDQILVVDLEATCWEGPPPPGEMSEIIEIGIAEVIFDGEPRLGRMNSYLIRPNRSKISPYCTALTGITPEEARAGRPFLEVINSLRKMFGGPGKAWTAWGRDDLELVRDCKLSNIDMPFSDYFIDFGLLWSMMAGLQRPAGLRFALEACGLQFEGCPHRAGDDAINTGRVLIHLAKSMRKDLEEKAHPIFSENK
jgi:inhibitor of KinA sporulation pathway (predicted exonuclease)